MLQSHLLKYSAIITTIFCTLGFMIFCWTIYYPYHMNREENYRKELKVLQDLCASGLIPIEFQLNSVTYNGKATNCSQAFVFTQIPIVIGALADMWEDSLIKFIINGGNWKIQTLASVIVLFMGYHITKIIITLLISSQFIEQLNPGQQISKLIHTSQSNQNKLIISKPTSLLLNAKSDKNENATIF